MAADRAYYHSTVQAIALSLAFAAIVILAMTRSVILTLLSSICISTVLAVVLLIVYMEDKEIGQAETVGFAVAIGLSVNYVVQLAAEYAKSVFETRHKKMEIAYKNVGVSLLSSAITAFGSSVFLFGGNLLLVRKVAVIIASTISISFLAAIVIFGSLAHSCGPQAITIFTVLRQKTQEKFDKFKTDTTAV